MTLSVSFNGWGVTLIDALDTMWVMDLRDEFYEAAPMIANMTFSSEKVRSPHFVQCDMGMLKLMARLTEQFRTIL